MTAEAKRVRETAEQKLLRLTQIETGLWNEGLLQKQMGVILSFPCALRKFLHYLRQNRHFFQKKSAKP